MHKIISKVSPQASFFLGAGLILLLGFVIGFFVLLSMVLQKQPEATASVTQKNVASTDQAHQASDIQIAPITDQDWIRGNQNAAVTIVEYSDLECPFCQRFHPTMQRVIEEYGDSVRWVYRHFPLVSLHSKAPKEAEAAECAGELAGNEGFWKFIDRVFEVSPTNNGLDLNTLPDIAAYVGIDREQFSTCLASGKYADKVQSQYTDAVSAGGQGTPYNVIITPDGEKIPVSGAVPFEQIQAFLTSVL